MNWFKKITMLVLLFNLIDVQAASTIKVATSILPIKYLVQRIGGDKVEVTALIGQGQNPEMYEPQPAQISTITKTDIYYQVGVPFERSWIKKIPKLNPKITIVDLRRDVKFISTEGEPDPHIWTSLIIAKQMAKNICDSLVADDPADKNFYAQNYHALTKDLDQLDLEIKAELANVETRTFLVFHPSWSYFARDYGLKQLAIEIEGKESGPQDLTKIIHEAKQQKLKVIFIQPQFGNTQAKALANTLNIDIDVLDPLAEDYISNLRLVAGKIVKWSE